MRSTRNRGMAPVERRPNTLPWAHGRIANHGALGGLRTRRNPQKTAIIEDVANMADVWLAPRQGSAANTDPVSRASGNPHMQNAAGRVNSTAGTRDHARMPYVLDRRTFSGYEGGRDTGIQGLEYIHLRDHPLLPNTDDHGSDYPERQAPTPLVSAGDEIEWSESGDAFANSMESSMLANEEALRR